MQHIGKSYRKLDAMPLLLGKPVFTDDLAPKECLIIKLLRSPHAHALVESIDTTAAKKVAGIEAIYTYEDIDQNGPRYTIAGQTYPEPSPYDRLIIDRHVRYVGDVVAIIAGATEKAVNEAMQLIKVKYEVLEPILDFHKALDNSILIHPESNFKSTQPVGADNKRNLCSHMENSSGDVDKVLSECDVVVDRVFHTKANQQQMLETFQTYCEIDTYGRLHVVSSTQIVFHCRRLVANALHIPTSKVRVTKPRVGGGFGAKQTLVSEIYPAFVTWQTKKPSKLIFTREEATTASSPRHEMEMHVRVGATKEGKIRAIDLYTLSNTGAYSEHGTTTVELCGTKSIPLYRSEAYRFKADVVYTNVMSAGAYRGFGAPQGCFALEGAVNELAARLNMDPIALRELNVAREGDLMPASYNAYNTSSTLDRCLARVRELSGLDRHPYCVDLGNGKVRAWGVSMAMQGSSIPFSDIGGATLKLDDCGKYTLLIGAADLGTGCDTILAQMAAEVLECELEDISVFGADTDVSPYDSGSYASSTTYATGRAVIACALKLREKICAAGSQLLGCTPAEVEFDGKEVRRKETSEGKNAISLYDISFAAQSANSFSLEETITSGTQDSPPPYIAAVAEIVLDKLTGEIMLDHYYACVDCGTVINENLARVQTEGGILQGVGMALCEDVQYSPKGRVYNNSLMQYKIPTFMDIGHLEVEFVPSYEKTGPFGAKSIGELGPDTPSPAIAHAVYNATGHYFRELPLTPEKIALNQGLGPRPAD